MKIINPHTSLEAFDAEEMGTGGIPGNNYRETEHHCKVTSFNEQMLQWEVMAYYGFDTNLSNHFFG